LVSSLYISICTDENDLELFDLVDSLMESTSDIPPGYPVDPRNFGTLLYHPYPPVVHTKELSSVFGFPVSQEVPPMMPIIGIFPFTTSSLPILSVGPFGFDPTMAGEILYSTSDMPSFLSDDSSVPTPRGEELASTSPIEEPSSGGGGDEKFPGASNSVSFDSSWLYANGSLAHHLTDKVISGVKDKRR
jgi:hypothetical protein